MDLSTCPLCSPQVLLVPVKKRACPPISTPYMVQELPSLFPFGRRRAMSSTISASITISGDENLSFADCTKAVGVEPTKTFVRQFDYDDSVVGARQWSVGFSKQRFESINDAMKAALEKISGAEDRLVEFARRYNYAISISCCVTIYEERPLYELEPEVLQVLARLGATFLLDIIDYSNHSGEGGEEAEKGTF